MREMKRLSIIWGILAVLIFGTLTAYGFIYIKKREDYKKLEEKLENLAHNKVEQEGLYEEVKRQGKLNFKTAELTTEELKVKEDKCSGYVVAEYKTIYEYTAYIKCDKYETKGYEK